eukprot:scaffold16538_cov47-Attheya_sp.AAC.1
MFREKTKKKLPKLAKESVSRQDHRRRRPGRGRRQAAGLFNECNHKKPEQAKLSTLNRLLFSIKAYQKESLSTLRPKFQSTLKYFE